MLKRYGNSADPHWQVRAQRWREELDGPAAPVALAYLLEWSEELHGRSGATMDGFAPLSYEAVLAWSKLTGRRPLPHEVSALMLLDKVRRNPPPDGQDADEA